MKTSVFEPCPHFFHLGGHSLLMMSLLAKIRQVWQADVALKLIFDQATLEAMGLVIGASLGKVSSVTLLVKQSRPEHIPLSFSQQRLWFLDSLMTNKTLYQVPSVMRLRGHYNITALQSAYRAMIERHESLRTHFESIDGNPYQLIDEAETISDLEIIRQQDLSTDIETYVKDRINTPFNLSTGPLIAGALIVISEDEAILLINMHHIITDGASMQVYFRELASFYAHYSEEKASPEPLTLQYVDYALWQRSWLQGEKLKCQVDYWTHELADIPEVLGLPTDYPRPRELTYAGDSVNVELSTELVEGLKNLATAHHTTMYMVLLSGFQIVLHRYTGEKFIVVGSPIANRRDAKTEGMLGFFVNTLALKGDFSHSLTVTQFLEQMKATTLSAYEHQDIPFEQLVTQLNVSRQINVNPLFQVMLAYQENHTIQREFGNLTMEASKEARYSLAEFDLTLRAMYQARELSLSLIFSKDLFKRETIARFISHFTAILQAMVNNPTMLIGRLPMLSEAEVHQQLITWNQTEKVYPHTTIHQLFELQVAQNPEAIALVFEEQPLTYRQLNERANQVAHYLRAQGIQPDQLVGLGTERSFEMIIGILAILKAGGAYVPLDPTHPDDRLSFMLQDTKVKFVLTQSHLVERWEKLSTENIFFAAVALDLPSAYESYSPNNLTHITQPDHLAYVIYTSGTTGQPKGVLVEHAGISNICRNMGELLYIIPGTRVVQFASMNFDAMVIQWSTTLTRGGILHLLFNSDSAIESLLQVLKYYPIEVADLTPSVLAQIPEEYLLHLKTLILAGETLNQALLDHWKYRCRVINAYGPTESSVCVTTHIADQHTHNLASCIGHPMANIQLYVLNEDRQLVPTAAAGELYIGGVGLARGYLNRADLTAEKFIWHKFSEDSEPVRLYKTGDLVRYLPDGNLEYIGRTDHQIKLRGFRIELGEIEAQLLKQAEISQATVLVREDNGNKQLVGYLVTPQIFDLMSEEQQAFIEDLKERLSQFLPEYMIPTHFQLLEAMPLNVNGKVDRKALLAIELKLSSAETYVSARTEIEKIILRVWQSVLRVERIGIHDDFFRLGGDSIQGIEGVARLQQAGFTCTVRDLFNHHTIVGLAASLELKKAVTAEQGVLTGGFSLLPIQQWFFRQNFSKPNHWNQSFLVKVPQLSLSRLKSCLKSLVDHHDTLRLRFTLSGEQSYLKEINLPEIKELNIQGMSLSEIEEVLTSWQSGFDIERSPLWQVGYVTGFADGSARLYFSLHHLIIDSVSWRIIIDDMKRLYEGKKLGIKSSSYRQWVTAVGNYTKQYPEEAAYWESQLAYEEIFPSLSNESYSETVEFDEGLTKQLLENVSFAYRTEINDILLTALSYALSDVLGAGDHSIRLEGHGRELIDESTDVSQTVGWFTIQYPVRLGVKENLSESIQHIKETIAVRCSLNNRPKLATSSAEVKLFN